MFKNVFIVAAKRTPFGKFGGKLKDLSATELQVIANKAAIEQSKLSADKIDTVVVGNILPTSIGIFNGLAVIFQMQAINLALVSQVIAVKRTSVLFSVFWGYIILGETGLKERAIGATIMVIGVSIISLL